MPIPIVTGPATQPYVVKYVAGDHWVGMRLRPSSGHILWNDKIECAVDSVLRGQDALNLLPELAAITRRNLTQTDLEIALKLICPRDVDPRLTRSIEALHLSGGRMRIDKLALYAGCSPRHLNRLFQNNTGLSAKTYAQLVQFHRALKLIRHEHLAISDAAFESGYADHAHLTRAFRRYGGFKPSEIPKELSLPTLPT